MKSLGSFIAVFIVLAAIGGLFYGAYLGAVYLWQVYAGLESVLRVVLLSSMATAFIVAIIISGAIKSTTRRAGREGLAEAKLALYLRLVESCQRRLEAVSADGYDAHRELAKQLTAMEGRYR